MTRRPRMAAVSAWCLLALLAPASASERVPAPEPLRKLLARDADPGTWSLAALPPTPDGRIYSQVAAGPELGIVVVFGGGTEHGVDNDAFWFDVDEGRWHAVPPGGPTPEQRSHGAAAWDPVGHRMLVFGGIRKVREVDTNLVFGTNFLNDLWALRFDPTGITPPRWEQLDAGGINPVEGPGGRAGAAMVYDPYAQRLLLHGGNDTVRGYAGSVGEFAEGWAGVATVHQGLEDVWSFDLAGSGGWTKLAGTAGDGPALFGHQAAFDPASRRLVVTGGTTGSDPVSTDLRYNPATWAFDTVTATWTQWATEGEPPAMAYAAYGYSPAIGGLLVARGLTHWQSQIDRQPVYALRFGAAGQGARWEPLPPGGTPHPDLPGVAGAVGNEGLFVFGGTRLWSSDQGVDNDGRLSSFDPATNKWRMRASDLEAMTPTAQATAAIDDVERRLFIVGGRGRARTVWQLDLDVGVWRRLAAAGTPPPGERWMSAAFDPVRNRLLVVSMRRVFVLSLGAHPRWSRVPALGDAPDLLEADAVYDPVRDRLLLIGGRSREPDYPGYFGGWQADDLNDRVYALHLSGAPAWRELTPAGAPLERTGSSATYDPVGDRVLVFGGRTPTVESQGGTLMSDVTELTLEGDGAWRTLATTGTAPSARDGATTAFDAANGRLLVYGGDKADPGVHSLSFAGGGAAWSKLPTTGDPAPRDDAAGAYDPVARRLLVFGGYGTGDNTNLAGTRDTYALELGGSIPLSRPAAPVAFVPPTRGPVRGGTWAALGPSKAATMPVALSPTFAVDRTIYAGAINRPRIEDSSAGVFVSRDAGQSWRAGRGDVAGAAVTRIAPAPSDPSRVYAASRAPDTEVPVFLSRDRGDTWEAAGEGLPAGSYFALAVHPHDADIAFAGGDEGGLYRTVTGGASWEPVAFEGEWVYGIAAVPLSGGVRLLAATRKLGDSVHGAGSVYRSDDLGHTWDLVLHDPEYVSFGFAHDPSDPRRVLLTAGRGIWRSDDGGATFRWLADRAIQASALAFDPTSGGDVVYGAGVAMPANFHGSAGGLVSPAQTPGLFRSTDGGTSWSQIDSAPTEDFGGVAVAPGGGFVVAASLESGPQISADGGSSFAPRTAGFIQSSIATVEVDTADPEHLVAAALHDGAYVSEDGGRSWTRAGVPDDRPLWEIATSPVRAGRVLGGNYSQLFKSEDGGRTWTEVPLDGSTGSYFRQPGAFAFHRTDPDTWYVAMGNGKFGVTHDNGGSFSYSDVGGFGACPIPLVTAADGSLLLGDTCGSGVFRSTDEGATWSPTQGLSDGNVTALAAHPSDPQLLWAGTLHRGVYRSTDGGRTWRPARAGLGFRYVRSLAVAPDGRVFAGLKQGGVFESDDGGETWTHVSEGLSSRDVIDVTADRWGRVFAGTNDGGAYELTAP